MQMQRKWTVFAEIKDSGQPCGVTKAESIIKICDWALIAQPLVLVRI